MNVAPAVIAQSTNLLSSESTVIKQKRKEGEIFCTLGDSSSSLIIVLAIMMLYLLVRTHGTPTKSHLIYRVCIYKTEKLAKYHCCRNLA